MATTKTLPDGKVVTMPAYNENADIAVINTDLSNITDNINTVNTTLGAASSASSVTGADAFSKISTLNSKFTSQEIGTASSQAQLDGFLDTLLTQMQANGVASFKVVTSAAFGVFYNSTVYVGTLYKSSTGTTYSHVSLRGIGRTDEITGLRDTNGWSYDVLALNSKIASQYGEIVTNIQYEVCANIVTIYLNGISVTNAPSWTKLADLPSGLAIRYSAHYKALSGHDIQITGQLINYRGSAGDVFGACTYVRG